jgi:hypothetical protein
MSTYDTDFYTWTRAQAEALRHKDWAALDVDHLGEAYRHARADAPDATRLPPATFPEACPWTVEQVLDEDFWPEDRP